MRPGLTLFAVLLLSVLLLPGCANAPAPPPETTAVVQVQLEEARADIERAKANSERVSEKWAGYLAEENGKRIKASIDARAAALVETAAAESRPVDAAEILALIAAHDAAKKASADHVAAILEATKDGNYDVALERIALALDYVTEISERERAVQRARKLLGLAGVRLPAPKESP